MHAQEREIYKRAKRCVNVRSSVETHTFKLKSDVLSEPGNSCKGWVSGLSRLEIFRWFMEKWFPIPRNAAVVGENFFLVDSIVKLKLLRRGRIGAKLSYPSFVPRSCQRCSSLLVL